MRWESLGEEVPRCVATGQSGFDPRVGHVDLKMTPESGRFLLHILPSGFMRLWHYGFVVHWRQEVTSIDLRQCPHCGSKPLVRLPLEH